MPEEEVPNPEDAKRLRRRRRRIRFYVSFMIGLYIAFLFIPQQIDLFPRAIPNPNPRVDPDSKLLFSSRAQVLVVTAHPDDAEFYLGAGLLGLAKSGAHIHLLACTDGDKGFYTKLFTDADQNRIVRRREQTAASAQYGADVTFLGYPDGRLRVDDELVAKIRAKIDELHAKYVICFDPDYPPRISHQDHRRSGEAATQAAQTSHDAVWLMQFSTRAPNYGFDISGRFNDEEKMLKIHASQFHDERLERVSNMVFDNAATDGKTLGLELAEGLRVSRLR